MPSTEFTISDADFEPLKDQVVVITGGSSGIGLATVKLLLSCSCKVVVGDINTPPLQHDMLSFRKTNVAKWEDLTSLFKLAKSSHGRIDHVFANAGIGSVVCQYWDEQLDEAGDLREPNHLTTEVNLKGMANTCALALHYMRRQESGGSIVLTASASAFQRFRATEYTMAKHGVLGFMRGMVPMLQKFESPIRINTLAPSWTHTGLVPEQIAKAVDAPMQEADAVARATALLMADQKRQGELLYIVEGRYKEIENAILLKAVPDILAGEVDADMIAVRIEKFKQETSWTPKTAG